MRRTICYLSVALLAFGTGSFVMFSFYRNTSIKVAIETEPTQDLATVSVLSKPSLHQETGIESLISDKEKAMLLFEPTLKKWLEKEIIAEIIESSPETIEKIMTTKLHRYEAPYLTRMARKSYKSSLLDLNGDGLMELSILFDCEESGGCELWVFKQIKRDFEVVLRTSWEFNQFEITKSRSKGFSDIKTLLYYPADMESESSVRLDNYKFDGQKYFHSGCSEFINRYRDKIGELRYLKKPRVYNLDDCC